MVYVYTCRDAHGYSRVAAGPDEIHLNKKLSASSMYGDDIFNLKVQIDKLCETILRIKVNLKSTDW